MHAKYILYKETLIELYNEGLELILLEKPTIKNPDLKTIQDQERLIKWITSTQNVILSIFNVSSIQFSDFQKLKEKKIFYASTIKEVCGFLKSILLDLEKGLLFKFEFLVAGELYQNVLEQAKTLVNNGYKDAASVLARTVVENALKKLAERANIPLNNPASSLNDKLKEQNLLDSPRHLEIKSWLLIGNSSAHGNFEEFSKERIEQMISNISNFLNSEFI